MIVSITNFMKITVRMVLILVRIAIIVRLIRCIINQFIKSEICSKPKRVYYQLPLLQSHLD